MPARPPQEFRRYRQALVFVYLFLVSSICLLLLVSVAWALWRPQRVLESARIDPHDSAALLACNRDLSDLVTSLQRELCTVEETAGSNQPGLRRRSWAELEPGWEERWRELGARCRFDELKNSGLGIDFDHMALVHSDLWNLHLAYRDFARTFIDRVADELQGIHRALDSSRREIEARPAAAGAGPR